MRRLKSGWPRLPRWLLPGVDMGRSALGRASSALQTRHRSCPRGPSAGAGVAPPTSWQDAEPGTTETRIFFVKGL